MARWLILAGLLSVALGLVWQFAPGLVSWFGRLPGDIRVEGARGKFFFPITSMLLVSVALTILSNLFKR